MIELKSDTDKIAFKKLLKFECIKQINQRISNSKAAIEQAQDTANSSDKSTAGDKYETSRAMGQIDSEMNSKQLFEAEQALALIEKIEVNNLTNTITLGSVFELSDILFFVAIGLGPIKIDEKRIMVVSQKSPFYEKIKGMNAGETFEFQDKIDKIKMVF